MTLLEVVEVMEEEEVVEEEEEEIQHDDKRVAWFKNFGDGGGEGRWC